MNFVNVVLICIFSPPACRNNFIFFESFFGVQACWSSVVVQRYAKSKFYQRYIIIFGTDFELWVFDDFFYLQQIKKVLKYVVKLSLHLHMTPSFSLF